LFANSITIALPGFMIHKIRIHFLLEIATVLKHLLFNLRSKGVTLFSMNVLWIYWAFCLYNSKG